MPRYHHLEILNNFIFKLFYRQSLTWPLGLHVSRGDTNNMHFPVCGCLLCISSKQQILMNLKCRVVQWESGEFEVSLLCYGSSPCVHFEFCWTSSFGGNKDSVLISSRAMTEQARSLIILRGCAFQMNFSVLTNYLWHRNKRGNGITHIFVSFSFWCIHTHQ